MNKTPSKVPLKVALPDGSYMYSTHTAELSLPQIPTAARIAHLFPALGNTSLLSIGQLCDAGCTAHFDNSSVSIHFKGSTILSGMRNHTTNHLWSINFPLKIQSTPMALFAINQSAKPAELVAFSHAALFSPAITTLQKALSHKYIHGFPGLTLKSLTKYPPVSEATTKGHLDQVRQNKQSTQHNTVTPTLSLSDPSDTDILDDPFPDPLPGGHRTHHCFASILEPTGQIFTDQTGRFILPSSTGNTQLFIVYDYDSNSILAEPMRNKSAPEILAAYKRVFQTMTKAGLRPLLQRLDNECSTLLRQFMDDESVEFQLVPPHVHRRNAAERAIRTFKNHFIAGLCSTDPNFPLHLWDRLLPQALITL